MKTRTVRLEVEVTVPDHVDNDGVARALNYAIDGQDGKRADWGAWTVGEIVAVRTVRDKGSTLARILREIRRKANYENAGFSDFEIPGKVSIHFPADNSIAQITSAIKESTRIYRDSWINPLIDDLIAWTEGKKDIRQIEKDRL